LITSHQGLTGPRDDLGTEQVAEGADGQEALVRDEFGDSASGGEGLLGDGRGCLVADGRVEGGDQAD
jgi:hypothetical protein